MVTNLHTFVVCAYECSPYLDDCVRSVLNQTVKSSVIITTATPNEYIKRIAKKYDVPLIINSQQPSISGDWNFGVSQVKTDYFTIAHQDDLYEKHYTEIMLNSFKKSRKPLIFFSDYSELRGGNIVAKSTLLNIKRIMLLPLRMRQFQKSKWIRRRILSFGNPICCPAVSFSKNNLKTPIFSNKFKCDLDWLAWENISKLDGEFLYIPKILMSHRIHQESTTTELIENSVRYNEDLEMFKMFWPSFIAKILSRFYLKSEKSNKE